MQVMASAVHAGSRLGSLHWNEGSKSMPECIDVVGTRTLIYQIWLQFQSRNCGSWYQPAALLGAPIENEEQQDERAQVDELAPALQQMPTPCDSHPLPHVCQGTIRQSNILANPTLNASNTHAQVSVHHDLERPKPQPSSLQAVYGLIHEVWLL